MTNTFKYFLIYKPYGMLSQFTKEVEHHCTLADLNYKFEKDIYPVGRLDKDSEGLLILSNDKKLTEALLNPKNKHSRNYWVQVDKIPTIEALQQLKEGVEIKVNKKKHKCLPTKVQILPQPPLLTERDPPIRFRKKIPTTWLEISLFEGKNRQVRKMTAKVGHPTLRLVRHQIVNLHLGSMKVGEVCETDQKTIYKKLELNNIR